MLLTVLILRLKGVLLLIVLNVRLTGGAADCADLETHKGSAGAGDIISILDQRTEAAGNRRRQTVLLSATLHSNLGALATLSLTQPVSVGIK